jgi:hypothetical protein
LPHILGQSNLILSIGVLIPFPCDSKEQTGLESTSLYEEEWKHCLRVQVQVLHNGPAWTDCLDGGREAGGPKYKFCFCRFRSDPHLGISVRSLSVACAASSGQHWTSRLDLKSSHDTCCLCQ